MDHSLEGYLQRLPTDILLSLLSEENHFPNRYTPEIYAAIREVLEHRQKADSLSESCRGGS